MADNYLQEGGVVQHTAAADIASGSVVAMGNTLGVALVDIATGSTGSVKITGVFTVPKVSDAVIAQGESLTWDVSANTGAGAFDDNLATPESGDITGAAAVAFAGAGDGATTMQVRFTGVPGTKTD